MILMSPRASGYRTWLHLASSIDTPALELAHTNPDGSRGTLYIARGDAYVLPDNGLILGFHVRYTGGSSAFFALDHSGPPDWHEKRAAVKEAAHFVWDAVSVGRMILARSPGGLAASGAGYVLRHTEAGKAVRGAVVGLLPDWVGSPPDPGYYRQSDGAYMIRGAYHL
ncbi:MULTISPECIES: hypothetical protein [Nocardiopsidaceae]|uniref:Uncharacterized protein n=1 Tax=Streptomonospora nanhaiensis TaxID=1323731 RepID=A0ABY6YFU5_9ACTN|nr:hypothetical protein [Streptomonospora nanhaiensis]WAE71104.1 hypothetical protein OUQ99_17890 [Streptomonospora nanhaiensis]